MSEKGERTARSCRRLFRKKRNAKTAAVPTASTMMGMMMAAASFVAVVAPACNARAPPGRVLFAPHGTLPPAGSRVWVLPDGSTTGAASPECNRRSC